MPIFNKKKQINFFNLQFERFNQTSKDKISSTAQNVFRIMNINDSEINLCSHCNLPY